MKHRILALILCLGSFELSGFVARAQSGTTESSGTSVSTNSPAQSGGKKVWTNEDVDGLHDGSPISTFKSADGKPAAHNARPVPRNGKDAKWYRDQIARLQAQIPPIDKQITELQDAIQGKATGDGKESKRPYGVKADQWPFELDQLQKKRDDIELRIEALQDEARHNGIPPGALP